MLHVPLVLASSSHALAMVNIYFYLFLCIYSFMKLWYLWYGCTYIFTFFLEPVRNFFLKFSSLVVFFFSLSFLNYLKML